MGKLGMFESPEGYGNYLNVMREMYFRFGASLEQIEKSASLPGSYQELIQAIDRDLESIDARRSESGDQAEVFKSGEEAGATTPTSEDWGIAYVLEGSAVGGSFMARGAREKLPENATMDFLSALASNARNRWSVFVEALESTHLDQDAAVKSALACFESVHQLAKEKAA